MIVASIYSLGSKSAIQYKTAKVDKGAISKYVTATGTINPVRTVLIGARLQVLSPNCMLISTLRCQGGSSRGANRPCSFRTSGKKAEAALAIAKASFEKAK